MMSRRSWSDFRLGGQVYGVVVGARLLDTRCALREELRCLVLRSEVGLIIYIQILALSTSQALPYLK